MVKYLNSSIMYVSFLLNIKHILLTSTNPKDITIFFFFN